MLFPIYNFTLPDGLTYIPHASGGNNSYTLAEWVEMESNGAVFIPDAGYRWGTSYEQFVAVFWTSSFDPSDNENAYGGGLLNPRVAGFSVRLVRDNN